MKILFIKKGCTGCEEAKKRFESKGVNFKCIDVDEMDSEEMALAAWHNVLGSGKLFPISVEDD